MNGVIEGVGLVKRNGELAVDRKTKGIEMVEQAVSYAGLYTIGSVAWKVHL